jgi:hypothetical protein
MPGLLRRAHAAAGTRRRLVAPVELLRVDLALSFIPGNAVALLNPTRELGPLALDELDVVIGELGPLLANLAFCRVNTAPRKMVPGH